jgi:hypothetical protein
MLPVSHHPVCEPTQWSILAVDKIKIKLFKLSCKITSIPFSKVALKSAHTK